MPVVNRIADFAEEMKAWRRKLHATPEIGFDCHETAGFIAERLRDFGVDEIHEGIATSGIVALIRGRGDGPVGWKGRVRQRMKRATSMSKACSGVLCPSE